MLLYLGMKAAVPYTFNGNTFCHWIGVEDEVAVGPNTLNPKLGALQMH